MRYIPASQAQIKHLIDLGTCRSSNDFLFLGKYHDLECQLIQEFTGAQRRGEISRMREVAAVLLHFKVYSKNLKCRLVLKNVEMM